jgi:hypothetical protein
MAKIKSTLDLVMEKVKNLNMTAEDKEELKAKEMADNVKAWAQKYMSGKMNDKVMKKNLDKAKENFPTAGDILKAELISYIEPEADNTKIVLALERIFDVNTTNIMEVLKSYLSTITSNMSKCLDRFSEDLGKEGISGSSVVPNLAGSKEWLDFARQAHDDLKNQLMAL